MEFVRELLRGKGGGKQGGGEPGGFVAEAGNLARTQAESGEDGDSLADGVVAAVVGSGEPLAYLQRLGDQHSHHALEAHFLEILEFVLVREA